MILMTLPEASPFGSSEDALGWLSSGGYASYECPHSGQPKVFFFDMHAFTFVSILLLFDL